MAHKEIVPKLGTNIDKAKIISWVKKEGERVLKGEVLVEVETDKATFEIEAEHEGYLRKQLYPEDTQLPTSSTFAIITNSKDENIDELVSRIKDEEKQLLSASFAKQTRKNWFDGKVVKPAGQSLIKMSPAARSLVKEKGLDIKSLSAHFQGKKDILQKEDIEQFLNSEKIVIYGAGLGAKQVLEVVRQLPGLEVVGLIDDNKELTGKIIYGYKVLGGFGYLKAAYEKSEFKAIALSFHSEVRKKIFLKLKKELSALPIKTLIDPRAIVSSDIKIGEGVFVEAGAVIGPGVTLREGVIVDLGVVICHDCFIGAHSHLSPACSLSGIVSLKENVLVGVGASINSTVNIGKNVIITPGSAVMNDLGDEVLVSGIPAVTIGESRRGK